MAKVKEDYTLEIQGDMTIYEALEVQEMFSNSLSEHDAINVNLSNVSEIDSSGLQLMVALRKDAIKENKIVSYQSHSQAVIDFLDLFDMTSYFGDPIVMEK